MRAKASLIAALFLAAGLRPSAALPLFDAANASLRAPAAAIQTNTADYLRNSSLGSLTLAASSAIAVERSHDGDVRRFARGVLNDPGANERTLSSALSRAGISLALPDSVDREHAALVEQLTSVSDGDFDLNYLKQQVRFDQSALRLNLAYAKDGRDEDLRHYAAAAVPDIRGRLTLAERLLRKLAPRVASAR